MCACPSFRGHFVNRYTGRQRFNLEHTVCRTEIKSNKKILSLYIVIQFQKATRGSGLTDRWWSFNFADVGILSSNIVLLYFVLVVDKCVSLAFQNVGGQGRPVHLKIGVLDGQRGVGRPRRFRWLIFYLSNFLSRLQIFPSKLLILAFLPHKFG